MRAEDGETCDGRLFHRRLTGNDLSPTVDRRVHRRRVRRHPEAEHSHRVASVSAGRHSSSHIYVGARPLHLYTKTAIL